MDTRVMVGSPPPPIRISPISRTSSLSNGSMFVSSPEGSPPPSPERSPGVGLRGADLLNMRSPVVSASSVAVPIRVGRGSNERLPAVRPSWLGPNNTGENAEVDFPPGYLSQQQEEDAAQTAYNAAQAAAQSSANTRSAIQAALEEGSIPPESVPSGVFKSLGTMIPPRTVPSGRGSYAPFGFGRSTAVTPATMFRPVARAVSTPRAAGGRRYKKTLKRRKTKNNRRRRASKTRYRRVGTK